MFYTNNSLERVREADIVKTIQHYCDLKREGSNYKCNSPFTNEKTPSFVVSPAKQMFKCFSSGNGGDGIKFVMLHETCEFIDAVEKIAAIHNILLEKEEVTPELQRKLSQKAEMYQFLTTVSRKYAATFSKLEKNHWALKMIKDREFNQDTLIHFNIGFAPDGNAVTKWAINRGQLALAKELGISDTNNSNSYDKFKERIIFPIHNHKGAIVGFGGRRSNADGVAKYPKYLNSKESLVYNKSAVLYGLFEATKAISKQGFAILTEGYTDVMSMYQNGCPNTIASCGTALTSNHAKLIKKYADEIIILRDGDAAGEKAIIKDIDVCLSNGLNVSLCQLPEGEDPDSFARKHGDMASWITENKKDALLWKVEQYDIIRDNYQRDYTTLKEVEASNINTLAGDLIPAKELKKLKGEELRAAKKHNHSINEEIEIIKKETKAELKEIPKIDPSKKSAAVDDVAKTLYYIKHEVKRAEYIKHVAKKLDITAGNIKSTIATLERQATKEAARKNGTVEYSNLNLPKGASKEEFQEHGFVTVGNSYYFATAQLSFFQGTTFKLQPLFHIDGDKENKRLCEITNLKNQKRLIEFDSEMLASFAEFRKYLFRIGGFMFLTYNGVRSEHFDKFVYRFDTQFEKALELLTMGWNKKGFFAFADGVYWNGKFRGVNKYGVMHLEGISEKINEYNEPIDYYYSPAFSVMHSNNQEGDDKYENDRSFVYKEAPITLNNWMDQLKLVFEEKAIGGTLFVFGSIFRDLFLEHYDSFPLMAGFGEKDSGKSAFGKILQNFFYYRLPALDLTQATHVGFSRRLSRNVNTVQFLDEYQDKQCDEKIFSGMMGAWNGIGREKGMNTGDKRTQYDKINSAIYYAGQFMPTRMENALATRTVSYLFQNREYTPEEKENFNTLLNHTNQGLSSLVVQVVQHRQYFENNLPLVHAQTVRDLKDALIGKEYQERIFGNVAMLFTTFNILKDKIQFPFKAAEVKAHMCKMIIDNSEQITDSNGLTEFWSILEFLFENKRINEGVDFDIKQPTDFKVQGENRTEFLFKNTGRKKILFLRLKSSYQYYQKEASTRENVDVIGLTTIRQYFKSRSYFIGLVKAMRFTTSGVSSCYAFDYDAMQELGLANLELDVSQTGTQTTNSTEPQNNDDDLPF